MNSNYPNISATVWKFFRFLEDVTGIDIEKQLAESQESGHTTIQMSTFDYQKTMVSILRSLNVSHYEEAYIKCYNLATGWFSNERLFGSNSSPDDYRKAATLCIEVADFLDDFLKFKDVYYPKLLIHYQSLCDLSDNSDDVNQETVGDISCFLEQVAMETSVTKYLHSYYYRKGSGDVDYNAPVQMKDVIVCSDNLDYLLSIARKNYEDNCIHISLTMKIEPIIDYSYFIVFVQFKDTTFIVTDNMEFVNPHVAVSSRNPRRRSEARENETGLPYGIIDRILEWRSDSTEVSKNVSSSVDDKQIELYIKKLSEFFSGTSRLQLIEVIRAMVEKISISHNEFKQIGTFSQMLTSQKLIGKTVDTESEDFDSQFDTEQPEKARKFFSEMMLPDAEKSSLPAPIIRDLTTVEHYREDVLVTAEQAQRYAEYYVAKREADATSDNMWNYYNEHFTKESLEFQKMLLKHESDLLPYIFSGDTVYMHDIDSVDDTFGMTNGKKMFHKLSHIYRGTSEEKNDENSIWFHNEFFAVPEDAQLSHGCNGEFYVFDGKCVDCGAKAVRKGALVFIHHWKHLITLMNVGRKDIPQCFRNYTSHNYVPYVGNSITSNINPKYLVKDPLSAKFSNRLRLVYPLCGNCIRKYAKQYRKFENALVLFSSKQMKVVDIVNYDEYDREGSINF